MTDINIELGGGKTAESINATGVCYDFESAARTVSVVNTGSEVLYAACGAATLAGLQALIASGEALPIPAGRSFTFEATYPRLRALALATASGTTTTVSWGAF